VTYPVGEYPVNVAAADLNGDDIFDIVTADMLADQISVLLGNGAGGAGDGTFQPAVAYPAGDGPRRLAVADLNRDGVPDVAVTNRYSDDFSVFLGAGDGTFAPEERFDAGKHAWAIVAADLDGDGAPEIVMSNRDGYTVSVVRNVSCTYVGVDADVHAPPLRFGPYNAPNPFNPTTRIYFTLQRPGEVNVDVYDVRGRLVRELLGGHRGAGRHDVVWDGVDSRGVPSASGLYFFRVRSAGRAWSGKMILAR
jgi:hypothetical protein